MFINEKNGIVQTSNNEFITKKNIKRVVLTVNNVISKKYILVTIEGIPNQKVFYTPNIFTDSNLREFSYKYENNDLFMSDSQIEKSDQMLREIKKEDVLCDYSKTAVFEIYNNNNLIGTHEFTKTYDNKLYLLAQWELIIKDIESFVFDLMSSNKEQNYKIGY